MLVVFGSGYFGVLFYEVVGYGFEGDYYCKYFFVFIGWLGDCIVVLGVMVIDDGGIQGWIGFVGIDDEGIVVECIVLVENGIFVGLMQD